MDRRFKRVFLRLGVLAIGAGIAAVIAVRTSSAQHPPVQQVDPAPVAVPATVAKATRQDVPIYATGVGNVEAYESVMIRARVDGNLLSVPVTEGQDVKQGALIAVIDPRPYQAILD
jgi:membrane fusion protein, multidrug efflux system